jgi:hypothetical protein
MIIFEKDGCVIDDSIYPKIRMEISDESNIADIMRTVKWFLLACGYRPDTVSKYIEDD